MKLRIYTLTIGAALLAAIPGCNKAEKPAETTQQVEVPPPLEPAVEISKEEPKVAAAPAPVPAPEIKKEPEPELAPEGIWFLRQAMSIETDAGIVGVKRGTQLTKVGDQSYKTPAGDEVTLTPVQVTNVLTEIREILAAEQMSAVALNQWKVQQVQAEEARRQAAVAATPFPPGTRVYTSTTTVSEDGSRTTTQVFSGVPSTPPPKAAATPQGGSSLDRGAYNEKKDVTRPARVRGVLY